MSDRSVSDSRDAAAEAAQTGAERLRARGETLDAFCAVTGVLMMLAAVVLFVAAILVSHVEPPGPTGALITYAVVSAIGGVMMILIGRVASAYCETVAAMARLAASDTPR